MIKDVLETALAEELNQHLNSDQEDAGLHGGDVVLKNRRNGYNSKTVKIRNRLLF
jgi:transposase-like protein